MIVVIGESGEYEQRYETLYGVFDSMEAAEVAVSVMRERAKNKWDAYYAWRARVDAALVSFEPHYIHRGSIWPNGEYRSYSAEQHAKAKVIAGPQPEFGFCSERLSFYEVEFGSARDGGYEAVKEVAIDHEQKAA